MKQALFLLLGYPGAGKSMFSKQLAEATGAVRVNGDEIRRYMFKDLEQIRNPANNRAVFGALDYVTDILLKDGRSVIVDASHNKKIDRVHMQALAQKTNTPVILIWIQTPLDMAKQRNVERGEHDQTLVVPDGRYQQMVQVLEEPTVAEKVIHIDGTKPFEAQLDAFNEQFEKLI